MQAENINMPPQIFLSAFSSNRKIIKAPADHASPPPLSFSFACNHNAFPNKRIMVVKTIRERLREINYQRNTTMIRQEKAWTHRRNNNKALFCRLLCCLNGSDRSKHSAESVIYNATPLQAKATTKTNKFSVEGGKRRDRCGRKEIKPGRRKCTEEQMVAGPYLTIDKDILKATNQPTWYFGVCWPKCLSFTKCLVKTML